MAELFSYLGVLESFVVGILGGLSVCAVIAYHLMLKYGFQKEGFGREILNGVYGSIRLSHIFVLILSVVVFAVFGISDGVEHVLYDYGIKIAVLLINGGVAIAMMRHSVSVHYAGAINAAGWTFLGLFHYYTIYIGSAQSVLMSVAVYILILLVFQLAFLIIRKINSFIL